MIAHQSLRDLSLARLKDARVLFDAGQYDGAAYLAGYSVELALKARICRHLKLAEYPGDKGDEYKGIFGTHSFQQLALLGGLSANMTLATPLGPNWSIVTQWNPEQRYLPVGSVSKAEAEALFAAIEDKPNGILTWVKKRW